MPADPVPLITSVVEPYVRLTAAERRAFAAALRPARWDSGAILFDRGAVCGELVLFESGLIRAYDIDAQGREANHRFLAGPNLATALTSVITGEPAEEWVEAVTPIAGFRGTALALALLAPEDGIALALAWVYVGLRVLHSLVQALYNRIIHRFALFALSSAVAIGLTLRAIQALF